MQKWRRNVAAHYSGRMSSLWGTGSAERRNFDGREYQGSLEAQRASPASRNPHPREWRRRRQAGRVRSAKVIASIPPEPPAGACPETASPTHSRRLEPVSASISGPSPSSIRAKVMRPRGRFENQRQQRRHASATQGFTQIVGKIDIRDGAQRRQAANVEPQITGNGVARRQRRISPKGPLQAVAIRGSQPAAVRAATSSNGVPAAICGALVASSRWPGQTQDAVFVQGKRQAATGNRDIDRGARRRDRAARRRAC